MNNIQITLSPVDGSVVAERPLSDVSDISQALAKAEKAQLDWQSLALEERQNICSKAVDYFVSQKDDIASEITWQMGRPVKYAAGEVAGFEERARYMIEASSEALKPVTIPEKEGFTRYICKEALGVVLVIAPWNYPYLTAINSIMPALLAGNAVLLKHSAQTPLCAERMVEAFLEAGLPEGLFQYLHMSHENTEYLIQCDAIKHVAFTGSVPAGATVEKAAAGRFIGMGLELGGKDPAYIRADADLDAATDTVIDGAFFNSGQSCCGIERLYVHEAIYDAFVEKAVALVKQYRLGRPDDPETTLGPLVKSSAADFVRGQVDEAVSQGAVAHIDPALFSKHEPGTPYLAPQLLTQVNHAMRVMTEESFGPVLGIQKVSSDEEAISLMNDSEFGLTAAIFSRDIERAVELGRQVQTGTFFVNRCDYLDPALAWTGIKNSGRGCTLSVLGFNALTRPKSFHIKHG
ncbi:aldehyde dehydrogenase family protein [Endozoicomonas sp. 8E]|uniref:aldehyde dehydrogenase family protein n=1 Tax=Endozoicomonas sp. 8E TaxID=3035692 RepID=UPI002939028F|nr:aldehyde dehydrogenase family protein [Endozoicomonas sp. 8E]WOG26658.1 aldehyde dehydrogenase family protein [Endozoicomonas sp. 8E]